MGFSEVSSSGLNCNANTFAEKHDVTLKMFKKGASRQCGGTASPGGGDGWTKFKKK